MEFAVILNIRNTVNGIHDLVYLNSEVKRESRFGCGTKKTSRWKPSETRAGLPLTCQKREFDHWNKYSFNQEFQLIPSPTRN